MVYLLEVIARITNFIHNLLIAVVKEFGLSLNDKELHFWVIGIIGILLYITVDVIFKHIARLSVSIITFIYTFTLLIVLVFGIEIEQKITGKGNMEFKDIVAGLWGFISIFIVYLVIMGIALLIKRQTSRSRTRKK